jgi:hypothetical protein
MQRGAHIYSEGPSLKPGKKNFVSSEKEKTKCVHKMEEMPEVS